MHTECGAWAFAFLLHACFAPCVLVCICLIIALFSVWIKLLLVMAFINYRLIRPAEQVGLNTQWHRAPTCFVGYLLLVGALVAPLNWD